MRSDEPLAVLMLSFLVEPAFKGYIMPLSGAIDEANEEVVHGWASDGSERALTVRILVDDVAVGECTANLNRPDVLASGQHPTGRCGFRFASDFRAAPYSARVFAVVDGTELPDSGMFLKSVEGSRLFLIRTPQTAAGVIEQAATRLHQRAVVGAEGESWRAVRVLVRYNFVSGQANFEDALGLYGDRGFRFFAMFREPAARLLSCLKSLTEQGPSAGHTEAESDAIGRLAALMAAARPTLRDRLACLNSLFSGPVASSELWPLFDNPQVRSLVRVEQGLVTMAVLDRAKAMLNRLDAIGLAEDLPRSLAVLERLTGFPWSRYAELRCNASRVTFEKDCEITDVGMEFLWADLELYDAARRRFP